MIDLHAMLMRHEGAVKEGERHVVYDDATGKPLCTGNVLLGVPTLGYGRNLLVGINDTEAEIMLSSDIGEKRVQLAHEMPWTQALPADVQAVLVNMAFNMGLSGLAQFKRFLGALLAGKYEDAYHEMTQSQWATQTGSRAKELAAIIRGQH